MSDAIWQTFQMIFQFKNDSKKSERSEGASEASIWATSTYHYIWSIFVFLCVSHNSSNWLDILLFCSWMMRFDGIFQRKSQFKNDSKKSKRSEDASEASIWATFSYHYIWSIFVFLCISHWIRSFNLETRCKHVRMQMCASTHLASIYHLDTLVNPDTYIVSSEDCREVWNY